mmetsp:Transcript_18878/g.34834  ORF Transcript_18878/g.34834 Transcript_18878/m.34834 type:complete len:114 (-) Transcript_18878:761-1102(-)
MVVLTLVTAGLRMLLAGLQMPPTLLKVLGLSLKIQLPQEARVPLCKVPASQLELLEPGTALAGLQAAPELEVMLAQVVLLFLLAHQPLREQRRFETPAEPALRAGVARFPPAA